MATVEIPKEYGYVILAATTTFIVNCLHSFNTGKYRARAKISYPTAYAPSSRTDEAAHQFNCAQRAHANFIENQPTTLGCLLLAGLKFPVSSAILGLAWSVSRYMYMAGYSQGGEGGKGRYKGIYFIIFQLGLMFLAAYTGVVMVL